MGNLPGPGIEPVFLALARGFLTARPPEKPLFLLSFISFHFLHSFAGSVVTAKKLIYFQ